MVKGKWKAFMGAAMAGLVMVSTTMTAVAAPFEAGYYAQQNPDVVAVIGNDPEALEEHYRNYGRFELRKPNVTDEGGAAIAVSYQDFDARYYARMNPDLVKLYGTNKRALYAHYIAIGMSEGRSANESDAIAKLAQPFDAEYYAKMNPDVVKLYGKDATALYRHYLQFGLKEGREANAQDTVAQLIRSFDADYYAKTNPELLETIGAEPAMLLSHFIDKGITEGKMPSAEVAEEKRQEEVRREEASQAVEVEESTPASEPVETVEETEESEAVPATIPETTQEETIVPTPANITNELTAYEFTVALPRITGYSSTTSTEADGNTSYNYKFGLDGMRWLIESLPLESIIKIYIEISELLSDSSRGICYQQGELTIMGDADSVTNTTSGEYEDLFRYQAVYVTEGQEMNVTFTPLAASTGNYVVGSYYTIWATATSIPVTADRVGYNCRPVVTTTSSSTSTTSTSSTASALTMSALTSTALTSAALTSAALTSTESSSSDSMQITQSADSSDSLVVTELSELLTGDLGASDTTDEEQNSSSSSSGAEEVIEQNDADIVETVTGEAQSTSDTTDTAGQDTTDTTDTAAGQDTADTTGTTTEE